MALFSSSGRRGPAAWLTAIVLASSALVLAGPGCGPPDGFKPDNPTNGCAALASCELCSSRGGCGWCASACVPTEGAQCATPIINAPNLCPGATPVLPASSAAPDATPAPAAN